MTDLPQPRSALQALVERMRSEDSQFSTIDPGYRHPIAVVNAVTVEAWADEIEAVLASWPPAPPEPKGSGHVDPDCEVVRGVGWMCTCQTDAEKANEAKHRAECEAEQDAASVLGKKLPEPLKTIVSSTDTSKVLARFYDYDYFNEVMSALTPAPAPPEPTWIRGRCWTCGEAKNHAWHQKPKGFGPGVREDDFHTFVASALTPARPRPDARASVSAPPGDVPTAQRELLADHSVALDFVRQLAELSMLGMDDPRERDLILRARKWLHAAALPGDGAAPPPT